LIPVSLAFVLVIGSQVLRREELRDLGLRFDNFFSALKLLALPMIVVTLVCVALGWMSGTRPDIFRWHAARPIVFQLLLGFAWGFVQQYVLQSFINRRAQIVWQRGLRSVLLTAAVFALLHFPNPWLMLMTFIGGLVWAFVYQRTPNLFALAVSHSVMTWVLVSTLPDSALNHLRFGFKYFAYFLPFYCHFRVIFSARLWLYRLNAHVILSLSCKRASRVIAASLSNLRNQT